MAKRSLPTQSSSKCADEPRRKKEKAVHINDTSQNHEKDKESTLEKSNRHAASQYIPAAELAALPQSNIDDYLKTNHIHLTDPRDSSSIRPITSFSFLPTSYNVLYRPLEAFSAPTPIQAISWPVIFTGRDVVGVAETGSGKTLAFGLPCLRKVLDLSSSRRSCKVLAVIITPTRELATQIYDQLLKFSSIVEIGVACVFGGVSKDQQRKEIKNASIIVATPGRLKDFLSDQTLDLSKVRYAVLDEADRMLDKGFEQDIRSILEVMPSPKKRQTILFTATWPPNVRELAAAFTKDAVTITIGEHKSSIQANQRIKQVIEVIKPYDKETRLVSIIQDYRRKEGKEQRILVFCLYKKEATRVERLIRSKGIKVAGIHGDLNQTERFKSLEAFRSGATPLLVATDVAARGLDIPSVKLVLNVTFPLTIEDYVHRIGRTGRAGADGLAITLFTEHDKALSGPLVNILRAANQDVPENLLRFGTTVKKKQHDSYGHFFRDIDTTQVASKIKFDD